MKLVIIEDKLQAKFYIKRLVDALNQQEIILICLCDQAKKIFDKNGIKYKSESDYIDSESLKEVVAKGWAKANSWYDYGSIKDQTAYKDINMASAHSLQLTKYFAWVYKLLILIENLMRKEQISGFYILKHAFKAKGTKIKQSEQDVLANALLEDIALDRKINSKILTYRNKHYFSFKRLDIKNRLKHLYKNFFYMVKKSELRGNKKHGGIAFFAGLSHIKEIALCDTNNISGFIALSLQLDNMYFCLKNNITHYLLKARKRKCNFIFTDDVFNSFCMFEGRMYRKALQERFLIWKAALDEIPALIDAVDEMLSVMNPSAVLLDQDLDEVKKTFVMVCKKRNIKTFVLSHGIPPAHYSIASTPLSSDFLFVGGELTKKIYIDAGVPSEKIYVYGDPRYKRIKQIASKSKENLLKDLNLGAGFRKYGKIALFALTVLEPYISTKSEWYYEESVMKRYYESLEYVGKYFSDKDVFLIIKAHQRTNEDTMMKFRKSLKGKIPEDKCIIIKHADTLKLIAVSDFILSHWSNVCMEALFLRKPLIVIDYVGRGDGYDVIKNGPALKAIDENTFKEKADEIMQKGQSCAFSQPYDYIIKGYANNLNSNAAVKIADLMNRN